MTDVEHAPAFPLLEIVSFVDATTVILVGHRVDELKEGDELYVLGIGATVVPKTNVPLIASKAKLEVTFPAGPYALARTPLVTVTVPGLSALAGFSVLEAHRTSSRRELTSAQNLFVGDPGKQPVQVGDPVIRTKDLMAFIKYRAEVAQKK